MTRTIAEKMFIRSGVRTYLRSGPENHLEHIGANDVNVSDSLDGEFDYVHLFAKNQEELGRQFSELKPYLGEKGALWVSWPKGGQLDTDLNLHEVIRSGYARGLVESTCLSIDETWSALRFTHPKPGKVYNNGHADLNLEAVGVGVKS